MVRFLIYIALPWPDGRQPYLELNLFVGLVGAGVVLVPFYLVASLCKIGNLGNFFSTYKTIYTSPTSTNIIS